MAEVFLEKYRKHFTYDYNDSILFNLPANEVNLLHLVPGVAIALYIIILIILPPVMKKVYKKPPPKRDRSKKKKLSLLDYIIVVWNFFLSISSFLMILLGFVPFTKMFVIDQGIDESFCNESRSIGQTPAPFLWWIWLFVMYKFVEMGDTFFLIIKNPWRPVKFLHWYHHITVLLVSYYAFYTRMGLGTWFGYINACVHTFMYYYYAMTVLGYKIKWAFLLTMAQILQMFIGVTLCIIWIVKVISGRDCACNGKYCKPIMIVSFGIVYASYLGLFIAFAFQRYGTKKKGKKAN